MNPAATRLAEGELEFFFGHGWEAIKYDDTAFHINHFQNFAGGCKAVDFVASSPEELWLIELFPQAVSPATAQQQLRRAVRAVDPRALVGGTGFPPHAGWDVR